MMRGKGCVERFAAREIGAMVERVVEGLGAREWVYRVVAAMVAVMLLATMV